MILALRCTESTGFASSHMVAREHAFEICVCLSVACSMARLDLTVKRESNNMIIMSIQEMEAL